VEPAGTGRREAGLEQLRLGERAEVPQGEVGKSLGDPVGRQAEQVADQVEIGLEGNQRIGLEVVLDGFQGESRVVGED